MLCTRFIWVFSFTSTNSTTYLYYNYNYRVYVTIVNTYYSFLKLWWHCKSHQLLCIPCVRLLDSSHMGRQDLPVCNLSTLSLVVQNVCKTRTCCNRLHQIRSRFSSRCRNGCIWFPRVKGLWSCQWLIGDVGRSYQFILARTFRPFVPTHRVLSRHRQVCCWTNVYPISPVLVAFSVAHDVQPVTSCLSHHSAFPVGIWKLFEHDRLPLL